MCAANRKISRTFSKDEWAVLRPGSCLELLQTIPDKSVQLVVTSSPYNLGKEYEKKYDPALNNNRFAISPSPGAPTP